jgi:hypothetical protein
MAKSNKELAVELYSAFLVSMSSILSNPNYTGEAVGPSFDEMVAGVEKLTERLSKIPEN